MGNSDSKAVSSGGGTSPAAQIQRSPTNRFRAIRDEYSTLEQVQDALRREGLESSNLIVAVDFTKSNEWTGKQSFGGRSLHHLGPSPNPYEEAMVAVGKTLATFDDDQLIPAYGFGDVSCQDSHVFSFHPDDAPCQGLESVVWRYRQLVPHVRLAGPTSFAPAIQHACKVVNDSGGKFHILLIIADGQVTRSSDLPPSQWSPQEAASIAALVAASKLPLSVVLVGVGDGPWDMMKRFDDALPERAFDNFQFVNFTEVMASCGADVAKREAQFAMRALMEIPEQYKIIQHLGLLGRRVQLRPSPAPLQPPAPPGPPTMSYPGIPGLAAAAAAPGGQQSPYPSLGGAPMPGWGMGPMGAWPTAPGSNMQQQPWQQQQWPMQQQQQPEQPSVGQAAASTNSTPSGGNISARAVVNPLDNPMFVCPITQDVMQDPVIAADGYTYEKDAIKDWLSERDRSPMTNQPLKSKELTPNYVLRSAIIEAREAAAAARQ